VALKASQQHRFIVMATVFILALAACGQQAAKPPAQQQEPGRPSAILVSPIHDAQVVRGDGDMDHVEYELLVVSVFAEPVRRALSGSG
jgi:hypothetical protein